MKILFILRKQASPNIFRQIILQSITSFKDVNITICSGFFSEGNKFKLSQQGNFANNIKANNIKLTTIGVYNKIWMYKYLNFVSVMKSIVGTVNYTAFTSKQKWHAKIYFLKKNSEYIITIIGSSNMTSWAFGTNSPYSIECDVVLWNPLNTDANSIILSQISNLNMTDYIIANQDAELDKLSIIEKLRKLEDEVLDKNNLEEPKEK
ncbi:MAG: restriction endonuclease PLD domain-containing protein [archaeon]